MIDIDLRPFCSRNDPRIGQPWSRDGYTFATEGNVMVRVPLVEGIDDNPKAPDAMSLFQEAQFVEGGEDIPELDLQTIPCASCFGHGVLLMCLECDGNGTVVSDTLFNDYENECKSCDGMGTFPLDLWPETFPKENKENLPCENCFGTGEEAVIQKIKIGSSLFSDQLLSKIAGLPGVKIRPNFNPLGPAHFKFDGGDGLLMPTR